MAENNSTDYIVPVVSEEVHAEAVPVEQGGVRVTKRVEGHEEILEQELRRGRAEVRRVKANRVVDGPQQAQQVGDTLVIPVVSEVLVVTKQWVVTEEIHITRIEEVERVEQQVTVNQEFADVERLDEAGNVVASGDRVARQEIPATARIVGQPAQRAAAASTQGSPRVLSQTESIIKPKTK
jgi:stress response protein YsnF